MAIRLTSMGLLRRIRPLWLAVLVLTAASCGSSPATSAPSVIETNVATPQSVTQAPLSVAPTESGFARAGMMTVARASPSATVLQNGKVLIAGGMLSDFSTTATAEIYDPKTGRSMATGTMTRPRQDQAAVLLPSGKVFVASDNSAETYDPATGRFTKVAMSMSESYPHPAAVVLEDGTVLIGTDYGGRATIYTPSSGQFESQRGGAIQDSSTAFRLADGRVAFVGGSYSFGASVFDPKTKSWARTAGGQGPYAPVLAAYALLRDGSILVAGGCGGPWGSSAATLDVATGVYSPVGNLSIFRCGATASLLPDGTVLVAGGQTTSGYGTTSAELYGPTPRTFQAVASQMSVPRVLGTVTVLPDGRVLFVGGFGDVQGMSVQSAFSAEIDIYSP